jgi:hypothetical protein
METEMGFAHTVFERLCNYGWLWPNGMHGWNVNMKQRLELDLMRTATSCVERNNTVYTLSTTSSHPCSARTCSCPE